MQGSKRYKERGCKEIDVTRRESLQGGERLQGIDVTRSERLQGEERMQGGEVATRRLQGGAKLQGGKRMQCGLGCKVG